MKKIHKTNLYDLSQGHHYYNIFVLISKRLPNIKSKIKDLEFSKYNIVSIGTPGGVHFEPIKLAIEFGCHVFCDKPLTDRAETAVELYELAEKKKVKTAELKIGKKKLNSFLKQYHCLHRLHIDLEQTLVLFAGCQKLLDCLKKLLLLLVH